MINGWNTSDTTHHSRASDWCRIRKAASVFYTFATYPPSVQHKYKLTSMQDGNFFKKIMLLQNDEWMMNAIIRLWQLGPFTINLQQIPSARILLRSYNSFCRHWRHGMSALCTVQCTLTDKTVWNSRPWWESVRDCQSTKLKPMWILPQQ